MLGDETNLQDKAGHKRTVLRLRWVTIIITSYLILFGRGIHFPQLLPFLIISFYLFSNILLSFLPASTFVKLSFFYVVLLFDTGMVSLGIYLTSQFNTDFYLVYFFIILFASIARSFKLLMINAGVICCLYGWFLWAKGWRMGAFEEGILLRIPFIFIMNLFYGFLVQTFEKRTRQIKQELEEVEASEQRYRQIVESAHDAVVVLDENNRIKFFNRRLIQLTHYAAEALTGMELKKIMEEPAFEQIIDTVLIPSKETEGSVPFTTDVFQSDGGKRKVEVSAAQFELPAGKVHTIIYLKDVTEKKQMEEELIRSEKLRALGEMAAGVAHDLNNVLGAILGRVQLIQLELRGEEAKGFLSEESLRKELEIIEQAAKDGAHTINKIQEFTRSKTDESRFIPVDINEILEGAFEFLKTKIKDEADAKGVHNQVRMVKHPLPPVMGDPAELREVFLNIFLNAMDAMPRGGTITLRTEPKNGHVTVEVSDDGVGMPESTRHRIFDPFFTTKGVRRSGLGLSVSYGIIRRHHGKIEVESGEGLGTTFRINFPAVKD
jgi:PAS domain S-box-containing protein